MRQVKSPISEHSHKSCIYPHWFCHGEQTQSAESMFAAMWSFICFVWMADLIKSDVCSQLSWQSSTCYRHIALTIWTRSWILMGNAVATFMLYYYMYCISKVTHSVTTWLHDMYFTIFWFNIFLPKRTVSCNNARTIKDLVFLDHTYQL